MKKKVLALLLCLALVLALPGMTALAAPAELTVTIWDEGQRPGLQQIVDDWSAQSGIKATIQVVDWNSYWTLLEAGAVGGQLPDAVFSQLSLSPWNTGIDKSGDITRYTSLPNSWQ